MSNSSNSHASPKAKPTRRKSKSACPAHSSLGKQASKEAGRRAAAVLEALAGLRTPSEAASALGISATHYYQLERKALAGLLAACEPQPQGARTPGIEKQLATVQRQLEDCQRQCLRQAALVRATQRAVGLPAAPSASSSGQAKSRKNPGKRSRRRPTVRALRAAETVRKNSSGENSPEGLKEAPTEGVEDDRSRMLEKESDGEPQG